jgi:hypothetical protein
MQLGSNESSIDSETRKAALKRGFYEPKQMLQLALTGLEARIGLVDDVDAAFTAHDAAVFVTRFGRLQRIPYFHDP